MTGATLRRAAALTALILVMVGAAAVPPSDSSVRGSVRTAAGSPAGGVWVVLKQGDAERTRALTADDGRYFIANLEPGDYRVDVLRGGSVVYSAQVSLPQGSTATFDIVVP